MKERVVAILPGRDSRCNKPGRGGQRKRRGFLPGQFPSGFLPSPGSVSSPGRPGPGSTRRAGPGFKTLDRRSLCNVFKQ